MIQSLTPDQTTEIYDHYIEDQLIHHRTTYNYDGSSELSGCIHENLIDLLPKTEYELNGKTMRMEHRIFDDMYNALVDEDQSFDFDAIRTSITNFYNMFTTVKTGYPKFDNKMRELGKKLRNKLISYQQSVGVILEN
jgi:hypothetical protein